MTDPAKDVVERLDEAKLQAHRLFLFSMTEELNAEEATVMEEASKSLIWMVDYVTRLRAHEHRGDEGAGTDEVLERMAVAIFTSDVPAGLWERASLRFAQAEIVGLRESAQNVHDTFKRDLQQGFRTRDKEFAVELLGKALANPSPLAREIVERMEKMERVVEWAKVEGSRHYSCSPGNECALCEALASLSERERLLKLYPDGNFPEGF